jgi:succinate dehydrogenase hydrophobic anchor subunit
MNALSPQPIKHWLSQRGTAIVILITLLTAPFSVFTLVLTFSIFWHFYLGLEEILADYIHNEVIGILFLNLLRIFLLLNFKYALVFFVF